MAEQGLYRAAKEAKPNKFKTAKLRAKRSLPSIVQNITKEELEAELARSESKNLENVGSNETNDTTIPTIAKKHSKLFSQVIVGGEYAGRGQSPWAILLEVT